MKKLLILFSIPFYLFSCSGLPSESQTEKDAKIAIEKETNGNFIFDSFKKENAIERDESALGGLKHYTIEFKGQIKPTKEIWNDNPYGASILSYIDSIPKKSIFQSEAQYTKSLKKLTPNDIKDVEGQIDYVKKENGWEKNKFSISFSETKK